MQFLSCKRENVYGDFLRRKIRRYQAHDQTYTTCAMTLLTAISRSLKAGADKTDSDKPAQAADY